MELIKFIANLETMAIEHPNLEVVAAKDAEGNGFTKVYYPPSIGYMNDENDFIGIDSFEEWGLEDVKPNAICVN